MKILFVEQDAGLRETAARHVAHQNNGDTLTAVGNMTEAIRAMKVAKQNAEPFNMVIAGDHAVGTQVKNPLLLLQYVKQHEPALPVAMYTALDREAMVKKLRTTPTARIPSQLVFSKPESLAAVIRRTKRITGQMLDARRPVTTTAAVSVATLAAG